MTPGNSICYWSLGAATCHHPAKHFQMLGIWLVLGGHAVQKISKVPFSSQSNFNTPLIFLVSQSTYFEIKELVITRQRWDSQISIYLVMLKGGRYI